MGLLLGGSVLTVFELLDLIVFRFANTLFGKPKLEAEEVDGDEVGAAAGGRVQTVRSTERPVSAVSTIHTNQRRIRRIAKYQPPTPSWSAGRPALVIQTGPAPTPGGRR